MRGPQSTDTAGSTARQARQTAAARTGRQRRARRPTRPPILGGKAVARLLYFEQQREIPDALEDRKAPTQAPTQALTLTPARPPGRTTRTQAGRATPAVQRLEAFTHKTQLDHTAPAHAVPQAWRPLGPFFTPHGQSYGRGLGSRLSVSGRVSAIAVDPTNASHILVGAAGGGVWESRDTGATWTPRTDDQPSLAIGAVAFNPRNPSIVYAGTGEGDTTFVNSPNLLGVGLLRSTDGGATWSLHARAPFVGTGFYDIAVDPANGEHLLAATTVGLFESTDGGTTWTQRRSQRTWDLSIRPPVASDPNATREVFAGCADGVFRSTNGGTSWSAVALPGTPPNFTRIEVCHAPSDGNVVYVFAAGPPTIPDPEDPQSGMPTPYLWRRAVAGGPFTAVTPPRDLQTGQAWYDWHAAVAPNNPNVLYVGGINTHRGVRSSTGVWTWTNISAKTSGDSIHPDQHAIAFSPTDPNVVYIGSDGGIYRSPDSGVSWQSLNKGLAITEVEFLAQHPQFETWLIAGLQDNGTMRYQGQEVWFHVGDGDGGDCGVNASSPYTCYHTFFGMGLARSTRGGGWETWTPGPDFVVGPPVSQADNYPDGALFYPPVEVNGRVVAQAGRAVFISNDSGTNWVRVPLPVAARELASALAIPTPTQIYVGTSRGRVFRLDFRTNAWQAPVPLAQPVAGFLGDLLVDPTDPQRLYATYQSSATTNHVFRSDDAGAHWRAISAGLPNIAINAIEIDPLHHDTLFVAADLGVYRSDDGGTTWRSFSNGLPNALVKDLVLHAPSRLLRAGTQARGVWEIALDTGTMPDVEIYVRDSVVDTGRVSPSPSGVNDPFHFGAQAFWFQSPDIKVDSPSFQRPSPTDVDFAVFADDESMLDNGIQFATGLQHENPQRNRTVRVFVQVHNRGVQPALNVAVKVFFAAAALTQPDLPAQFWPNFPNNVVAAASPWQPVAPYKVLPSIEPGKPQIVAFDWAVPATAPQDVSLLAIISADNDTLATTEQNIASLVQNNKKCGLKSVTVVNPSPTVAPAVRALPLEVRRAGASRAFALEADRTATALIRGVVLSRRLANLAKRAGLKQVPLQSEEREELDRLLEATPVLKGKLDMSTAYALRTGRWLENVTLASREAEALVLLVHPQPRSGQGSLVQRTADGTIVGGYMLKAI